jgi:hypothetical protein
LVVQRLAALQADFQPLLENERLEDLKNMCVSLLFTAFCFFFNVLLLFFYRATPLT